MALHCPSSDLFPGGQPALLAGGQLQVLETFMLLLCRLSDSKWHNALEKGHLRSHHNYREASRHHGGVQDVTQAFTRWAHSLIGGDDSTAVEQAFAHALSTIPNSVQVKKQFATYCKFALQAVGLQNDRIPSVLVR